MWGSLGLDSRSVSWVCGAAWVWTEGGLAGCAWVWTQGRDRLAGYVGLSPDPGCPTHPGNHPAWVWTQGRLAGCVGQPGSGLKVVTWVCGAAWVWTQGGLAGCAWVWTQGRDRLAGYVGQPGSGLKVG